MIDNRDITVVVQGPVQSLPEREQDEGITRRCLGSVRQWLPGANVILSTWPDQALDGLDFDELVINDDPGMNNCGFTPDGKPRPQNTNRQIVSTVGGLRRVSTPYAMKLRADNYLTSDAFKSLQTAYPQRCDDWRLLRERVVVANTLARRYYHGRRVAFFLSDFFGFGRIDDLLNIWDLRLFDDFGFDEGLRGALQHDGAPHPMPDVDQILAQRFVNKNDGFFIDIRHRFDTSDDLLRKSDLFFANNFVVAAPREIGLGLPLKFTQGRQAKASSQATCLSPHEWRRLYRRYCDRDYKPPLAPFERLKILLLRIAFGPLKAAGSLYRLLRERWRYARAVRRAES